MKNYEGKLAELKRDVYDEEEEIEKLYKGEQVIIKSIEIDLGGFGYDYVNIQRETGEMIYGLSTYELILLEGV